MGVIKKFMIQGILEIDSEVVKTEKEAVAFMEETLECVLDKGELEEKFKVRQVAEIKHK